jgi:hypothetical protein
VVTTIALSSQSRLPAEIVQDDQQEVGNCTIKSAMLIINNGKYFIIEKLKTFDFIFIIKTVYK